MSKSILRITILFLIPCLILDPALASGLQQHQSSSSIISSRFSSECLSLRGEAEPSGQSGGLNNSPTRLIDRGASQWSRRRFVSVFSAVAIQLAGQTPSRAPLEVQARDAIGRVVQHLRAGWGQSLEAQEIIDLAEKLLQGAPGFGIRIVDTLGGVGFAHVMDPPERIIEIARDRSSDLSPEEREAQMAHEFYHWVKRQQDRFRQRIQLRDEVPDVLILSSDENAHKFMQTLSIEVENELEARNFDVEYRTAMARQANQTLEQFYNARMNEVAPVEARMYRKMLGYLVGGRTLDQDRTRLLVFNQKFSRYIPILERIAERRHVSISTNEDLNRWLLTWLKDPAYYDSESTSWLPLWLGIGGLAAAAGGLLWWRWRGGQGPRNPPTSTGPNRTNQNPPHTRAERRAAERAKRKRGDSTTRREFLGEASGTIASAFIASPIKWFERLLHRTPLAVSMRSRISPLALSYHANQPPLKRHKSVDYTNIEDDYDASHQGGLGTNLFGQLTSVRLSGNPSNQIFPEGQISIYEEGVGATPLGKHPDLKHEKDKRLSRWPWTKAEQMANSAVVKILHPFSQWEYGRPLEQKGQVTVRRFSPMVPGNVNVSNLPISITEVEIENTGKEPRTFSVMMSMPNFAGWNSKVDDPHYQLLPTNEGQYNAAVTAEHQIGVVMGAHESKDPRFLGQTALFTAKGADAQVATYRAFDVNGQGADEVWNSFEKNGTLPDQPSQAAVLEAQVPQNGKEVAGAVAVRFTLQPGERRVVPFSYAFDFPNDIRNGRTFRKNYTASHSYNDDAATAMAKLAVEKHDTWAANIHTWQDKILKDRHIPDHVKTLLINEIYFLIAGGALFAKEGGLYLLEGWDPRLMGTSDVWFYTPMLAELFPELEKGLIKAMASGVLSEDTKTIIDYHGPFVTGDAKVTREVYGGDEEFNQKEIDRLKGGIEVPGKYKGFLKVRGAAPHHLDDLVLGPVVENLDNPVGRHINRYLRNHNTWKDLSPKFVLMVWRAYAVDGKKDKAFLNDAWEAVQATLEHQKSFIDESGLPVHQGFPDWTYDTWSVKGYTTYTSVLTLEALKAAVTIGKELGKSDAELQGYLDWLVKGQVSLQKHLWNEAGGYFYASAIKGKDDSITPTTDVMADALMGTEYAKLYGLDDAHPKTSEPWRGPIVSDKQIRGHLQKVYQTNFEQFHGGTVGIVNSATIDGKPLLNGADVQAGEVWIGTQRAVVALMHLVGMRDAAVVSSVLRCL